MTSEPTGTGASPVEPVYSLAAAHRARLARTGLRQLMTARQDCLHTIIQRKSGKSISYFLSHLSNYAICACPVSRRLRPEKVRPDTVEFVDRRIERQHRQPLAVPLQQAQSIEPLERIV